MSDKTFKTNTIQKRLQKIATRYLCFGFIFLGINNAHAGLSATTANVIQGTAPKVIKASVEKKLGFTVDGDFYTENGTSTINGQPTIPIDPAIPMQFAGEIKLNAFTAQLAAFSANDDYDDTDGDGPDSNPFVLSNTTITWTEANNTLITGDDLKRTLGCDLHEKKQPFNLIISANVQVKSEFGIPNISAPETISQKYQITFQPKDEVCYLSTQEDETFEYPVNNNYNPTTFLPGAGFYPNSGFPTTAFPKAAFIIKVVGDPDTYTYTPVPATTSIQAEPDKYGGFVMFNSRPPSGTVIRVQKGAYTKDIPIEINTWLEKVLTTTYKFQDGSKFPAASQCKDQTSTSVTTMAEAIQYFLAPNELSNGPLAWDADSKAKRDVGSLVSEWGNLSKYGLANPDPNIWTNSPRGGEQIVVGLFGDNYGRIGSMPLTNLGTVYCAK